jgi:hypothetical protein
MGTYHRACERDPLSDRGRFHQMVVAGFIGG